MSKLALTKKFIKNPKQIGAICPSSPHLCREMVANIDLNNAQNVVELGPGTGVITSEIINSLNSNCSFLTIELDPNLCYALQNRFPEVNVCCGSATDLSMHLENNRMKKLDAVISGLPWAIFPENLQMQILTEICKNLSDDGYFVTFAYLQGLFLPAGRRFKKLLLNLFDDITISSIVWKNMPPAIVYRCKVNRDSL